MILFDLLKYNSSYDSIRALIISGGKDENRYTR